MKAPAVNAEAIRRRLDELWRSVAASSDESEILRACAMTLVVLTERPPSEGELAALLAELVQVHPFRAVVVGVSGAGPELAAEVTVRCAAAPGRRTEICSEQIELAARPSTLAGLKPVVLGLLAADLPVLVWVREASGLTLAGRAGFGELGDKIVFDTGGVQDWRASLAAAAGLARPATVLADLAWTRLTPWRALLAEAWEDPERRTRPSGVEEIEIRYGGAQAPSEAVYLAAWLRTLVGETCGVTFLAVSDGEPLEGVRLTRKDFELTVRRTRPGALELTSNGEPLLRRPHVETLTGLLAEELSFLGPDRVFRRVLETVLAGDPNPTRQGEIGD